MDQLLAKAPTAFQRPACHVTSPSVPRPGELEADHQQPSSVWSLELRREIRDPVHSVLTVKKTSSPRDRGTSLQWLVVSGVTESQASIQNCRSNTVSKCQFLHRYREVRIQKSYGEALEVAMEKKP